MNFTLLGKSKPVITKDLQGNELEFTSISAASSHTGLRFNAIYRILDKGNFCKAENGISYSFTTNTSEYL